MKILNKISRFIATVKARFVPLNELDNPLASPANATVKEDSRDKATKKRVAQSFKAQHRAMRVRSLKPHDATCKDPLMCKQAVCFKRTSDKIVSRPYKVVPKKVVDESMGVYSSEGRRMRKTACRKKITS